mmetsp:Transcript_22578/g.49272  ORF Transcript_22578/g.49272 Transcript_22578/m.49272 type:complete len:823 (-) Transcript_22578:68-2536(-)|eukprot:CAMPEP_0168783066 /NCGR_PEP_ID=MMETSP0725-20121227/9490_1 /TAXON_ID=265536 /ORGANISM="Amphiprora sp., Strain CCMP467" /LENGTH=822 /DNA_ID=CAMNT_0008833023 /DNA_START=107 /DNA_END=2575 /DNA_ORIENTATION=+
MVTYHFLRRLQDGSVLSKSEETNNTISPGPGIVLASLVGLVSPGSAPRVFAKVQNAWNEKGPYDMIEEGVQYGVLLPQEDELDSAFVTLLQASNKRKKGEKSGSLLDSEEAVLTTIESALKAYHSILSLVVPGEEAFLKTPDLSIFTKGDLPHTGTDIDVRFGCCLPHWGVTPVGERLGRLLTEGTRRDALLIGKSGCGKTTAIFEAAMAKYCLLFTATSNKSRSETGWGLDPGAHDYSFAMAVASIESILADKDLSENAMKQRCDTHILALILSRTLIMYHFSQQTGFDNSPKAWLIYQLTRQVHTLATRIYLSLSTRKKAFLDKLQSEIQSRLDWFYAFDEAQYGYELLGDLKEQRIWKRTNGDVVGIASPFLEMLGNKPVVVAGTALSLQSVASCKSDLGKRGQYVRFDDFPSVYLSEVTLKLANAVDLSEVELSKVPHLWKLEGRGRLIGGLLGVLAETLRDPETSDKTFLLGAAIDRHYKRMKKRLIERIKAGLCKDGNRSPLIKNPTPRFPESLESLAISCLLGGSISRLVSEFDVDLLHCGLCSLKEIDDQATYQLNEELGKEAILDLAQEQGRFAKNFSKVAQLCRPAGGHAMEPLLVVELRAWSQREDGATVMAFLSQLFDDLPDNMPSWMNHSKFCVAGGFTKGSFISHAIKNDVDFVRRAFGDNRLRNRLLSPSTVKRPDFEAVMGQETDSWFLTVSSKLYSTPYDDRAGSDLRSTMPDMFYKKKDGTKNNKCKLLRSSWEGLLAEKQGFFKRNLRIHFCLPDVILPDSKDGRVFIEGDSVVAYVTAANVGKIFRNDTVGTLREIGCLGKN